MNLVFSGLASASASVWGRWLSAPLGAVLLLTLAACNGTAVVTLTSTPSTDTFLTYRVGLVSVQLQTSSGRTTSQALPSSTTVDLAQLVNLSEVLGAASIVSGNFTQAVVTLDYSSADIVYDDGSIDGIALTPLGASGQALGQVTLTLDLDPANSLTITRKGASRLSLDFNLAASNIVNLAQKTVTVTPLIAASASPIDTKTVRIRGPLSGVSSSSTSGSNTTGEFSTGIVPFDFGTTSAGSLRITPSTVTTFEINGAPSIGTGGLTQLASLSSGVMTVAFGTLTASSDTTNGTPTGTTTTCADGSTPTTVKGILTCADGAAPITNDGTTTTGSTNIAFAATEVLAGSSVQGSGFDRISGIVSARSGNTLTVEDGTLVSSDGGNTFIPGTATITMGPNTQVTEFGAGAAEANGTQQISVGSLIYAFGTASSLSSGNVTLDASAGRVRLGQTTASGIVTAQGTGTLTLSLASGPTSNATLGGRSLAAFDFIGTGTSASYDASAAEYQVSTGNLDLSNSTVGLPVQVTGLITAFGAASPTTADFSASTLLDETTINAELVLDWGAGTPAPFASYDTSQITVDARNSSIGARHEIQIGAQTVNIVGIASDPQIVPNGAANTVFTIGHAVSGTFENFITYAAFITQLQTELNGSVLATGITALGQYTTTGSSFSASSITLFLNN
jgi:hypothetical protein